MFYRLSNSASREQIEDEFDAFFQYPTIYRSRKVIDGLKESMLPIITLERPRTINPAIWGILPTDFSDDWQVFQKHMNTLNIPHDTMDSEIWYSEAFRKRRCLIIVTGYYTCFIADGELYPFLIRQVSGTPFGLAGIYNQLEDGFFTSSPITSKCSEGMQQIHNLNDRMPITIPKSWQRRWLDPDVPIENVRDLLKTPLYNEFRAIPVSKQIMDMAVMDATKKESFVEDDAPLPLTLKHLLSDHNIIGADFK